MKRAKSQTIAQVLKLLDDARKDRDAATRALETCSKDYYALRVASIKLVRAACFVNTEYDGLHRMLQASSDLLAIVATESGRPLTPKVPV